MDDERLTRLLERLRSKQAAEAWAEFLELYSPLILQVIKFLERDADSVADCYLFVCEKLSDKNFRRLLRYRSIEGGSFTGWLRAVVRNLCFDWRRREFGRHRVFESLRRLAPLEQEVFRCRYNQGLDGDETFLTLKPRFPNITRETVEAALEKLARFLTPRQQWLLSGCEASGSGTGPTTTGNGPPMDPQARDPGPDPESLASLSERREALALGLKLLSKADRLIIRLRFEQGLTLQQVARLTGLKDAQAADRRIKEVIERLKMSLRQ